MALAGRRVRGAVIARCSLAAVFAVAGIVHVAAPGLFAPLMPSVVPFPVAVIVLTGFAEIAGAVGLFVPRVRAVAGVMLAVYAVAVFPVNIAHAVRDLSSGTGLGWVYHYPRLFVQPLICWWALVAGGVSWAPRLGRG